MSETTSLADPSSPAQQNLPPGAKPRRLWAPFVFVLVFWTLFFVIGALEKPYFVGFLYSMAAPALLVLVFFGWWWASRRIPFLERLYCFCVVVGLGIAVAPLCDRSIRFGLPTIGLPLVLTTWTLWMLVVRKTGFAWSRTGLFVVVALTWATFTLIRIDGIDADLRANTRWRWEPSAEDLFLAEKVRSPRALDSVLPSDSTAILEAVPGDWTEFRGPERDGVIHGVKIATDWSATPPKLVWRQRVGPAWSSMIVVGDRLFTQEQRGEQETVVCYEAGSGKEIWVEGDSCRFWEGVSGAGPRATPTFAGGRVYTMGGIGLVDCRDARTGKLEWSHDLVAEAGGQAPLWGYSGSPLVTDGVVIVHAGGPGGKLLAYRAETGDPVWSTASSESYSSPQAATIAGKKQCLMLGDGGLTSHDLSTGNVLWTQGPPVPGAPRVVQPHLVGQTQLVATLGAMGVSLIDVAPEGTGWKVDQVWATTQIKPEFPDIVVHEGHLYGFDGSVFCCIDLATGKRAWKEGRYGRGQVMLLAEQSLLLVLSETGEALLLAASPQRHQELARFRALEGKTWNHPVIAHGRLYVRNAEEMACYELASP